MKNIGRVQALLALACGTELEDGWLCGRRTGRELLTEAGTQLLELDADAQEQLFGDERFGHLLPPVVGLRLAMCPGRPRRL